MPVTHIEEQGGEERTINSITFEDTTNAQRGSGRYGRILNDAGSFIVRLSFSNNSSGVFRIDNTPLPPMTLNAPPAHQSNDPAPQAAPSKLGVQPSTRSAGKN